MYSMFEYIYIYKKPFPNIFAMKTSHVQNHQKIRSQFPK